MFMNAQEMGARRGFLLGATRWLGRVGGLIAPALAIPAVAGKVNGGFANSFIKQWADGSIEGAAVRVTTACVPGVQEKISGPKLPININGLGEVVPDQPIIDGEYSVVAAAAAIESGVDIGVFNQLISSAGGRFLSAAQAVEGVAANTVQGVLLPAQLTVYCVSGGMAADIENRQTPAAMFNTGEQIIILDEREPAKTAIQIIERVRVKGGGLAYESNGVMKSSEAPTGWQPPEKDYCGHNMPDYFARLFINSIIQVLFMAEYDRGVKIDELKEKDIVAKGMENDHRVREIEGAMKEENCYFYQGGSVFGDFKIMRDKFLRQDYTKVINPEGNKLAELIKNKRWDINTPFNEVYQQVLEIVNGWWQ